MYSGLSQFSDSLLHACRQHVQQCIHGGLSYPYLCWYNSGLQYTASLTCQIWDIHQNNCMIYWMKVRLYHLAYHGGHYIGLETWELTIYQRPNVAAVVVAKNREIFLYMYQKGLTLNRKIEEFAKITCVQSNWNKGKKTVSLLISVF